jgi:DNA-binding transcriptional LysR family regulator
MYDFASSTMRDLVSISTDQLATLVEVSRHGTLRGAWTALFISEHGIRNRLIALERELGVELYRKARGIRTSEILTKAGRALLPEAIRLLEAAGDLKQTIHRKTTRRDIRASLALWELSTALVPDGTFHFPFVIASPSEDSQLIRITPHTAKRDQGGFGFTRRQQ